MRVFYIRNGFANNSSSDHHIVLLDSEHVSKVINRLSYLDNTYFFGWEDFILTSPECKANYAAAQIFHSLQHHIGRKLAAIVTAELVPSVDQEDFLEAAAGDYYDRIGVDHQSVLSCVPNDRMIRKPSAEFAQQFASFLLRDNVVIYGGNDNSDTGFEPPPGSKFFDVLHDHNDHVARWDSKNRFWTLFNMDSGTKIRLSFDTDDVVVTPSRSSFPELVDLRITSQCDNNCPWCYQDASPSGKHADADAIHHTLYNLGRWGVFEVSLGGGDVLTHPELRSILGRARDCGIVPTFAMTLDSLNRYMSRNLADTIRETCGLFAMTVTSQSQVAEILNTLERYNLQHMMSANIPLGIVSVNEIRGIIAELDESYCRHVTLLGYKDGGRGANYTPEPYTPKDVLSLLKNHPWYMNIAIDAKLTSQCLDMLKENFSDRLYDTKDGIFSMYVDLVSMKAAPTSYSTDSYNISGTTNYKKILLADMDKALEAYHAWQEKI